MTRISKGDKFPIFSFQTAYKDDLNSKDILQGKTIFWVLRYIGCTVCRYDVHLIAQRYDEFLAKNAQVFVVMQSDRKHVVDDLKKTDTVLPFEIITDPDKKIYELLDIKPAATKEELAGNSLDQLKEKGGKAREVGFVHGDYEGDELQLPALFIVNEKGVVEYANYAEDIMDMPKVDDVLNML
ncbi:MAG: redoxin domain-containing protein [Erysipelotrichaceae bacterium]|nr:redoxin domain-containing protein [Erysipelotrichaceae bacterium]